MANAKALDGGRVVRGVLDFDGKRWGIVEGSMCGPRPASSVGIYADAIERFGIRRGDEVECVVRDHDVVSVASVCGMAPEEAKSRPDFRDLVPVYPDERLRMEHGKDSILGRCIDIIAPIGKGQRGLIVSPPKAGKTTVIKSLAASLAANNPEVRVICLLVDERPEEVTDISRSVCGDVMASTFDMSPEHHVSVATLALERAKRLVEAGGDVVILLDSITRLARACNLVVPSSGKVLSGGVDAAALAFPKKFLGAARNIEGGGSLTIIASALVETGSKMDEVIFEEFKGTGNMELRLSRELAEYRVYPAIDVAASGTRHDELLLGDDLHRTMAYGLRDMLLTMKPERAMRMLTDAMGRTKDNDELLVACARKARAAA